MGLYDAKALDVGSSMEKFVADARGNVAIREFESRKRSIYHLTARHNANCGCKHCRKMKMYEVTLAELRDLILHDKAEKMKAAILNQ